MAGNAFKKIYGNCVVLANLQGQRHFPYAKREEIERVRDARLRWIVRYAAKTVPYYRELFVKRKIDPRDIQTAEDLRRLPLVAKDTLRQDPERFTSDSRWGKGAIAFQTRGSTGFSVRLKHDVRSLLANIGFGEREREVITRVYGRKLGYRELYLGIPDWTIDKVWDFYREWTWVPVRPERMVLMVTEPLEGLVAGINDFKPDVLMGVGSLIELLFRTVSQRQMFMHRPRLVVYGGDAMTPEGKQYIEERGIAVLTQYNSCESFKMGFSCELRKHLHIHEDLCHIRIVDGEGRDVPDGDRGQVAISNLVNRGTVLLNYCMGDVASFSRERCGCGRNLRSIDGVEGRIWDVVQLPNGEFVHPHSISAVFRRRSDILRYQLVQHEAARFELKLLAKDAQTCQRAIPEVMPALRSLLGHTVEIEARFAEELAAVLDKFRTVVSLYTRTAAEQSTTKWSED